MLYGIFAMICMLLGAFLFGKGTDTGKCAVALPGIIMMIIGVVVGILAIAQS